MRYDAQSWFHSANWQGVLTHLVNVDLSYSFLIVRNRVDLKNEIVYRFIRQRVVCTIVL